MLTRTVGFLDIEKLIEHRPAIKKEICPVVPQRMYTIFDSLIDISDLPVDFSEDRPLDFYPMHCFNPLCNDIITGSLFKSGDPEEPRVVCEDCYFRHFYGKESFVKQYKHCILPEAITPEESRRICSCSSVPHSNGDDSLALFPVPCNARHHYNAISDKMCKLCSLDDIVAVAKHRALCEAAGIEEPKKERSPKLSIDIMKMLQRDQPQPEESTSRILSKFRKSSKMISSERMEQHLHPSATLDHAVSDPQAEPNVPAFFKAHVDKDPFANVHVRLRIGPLIVENGISL